MLDPYSLRHLLVIRACSVTLDLTAWWLSSRSPGSLGSCADNASSTHSILVQQHSGDGRCASLETFLCEAKRLNFNC